MKFSLQDVTNRFLSAIRLLILVFIASSSVGWISTANAVPSVVTQLGTAVSQYETSSTLSSFTVPAGSNRLLVVVASDVNSNNVTGVTFNGNAMIEVLEGTDNIAVDSIYVLALGTAVGSTTGDIVMVSGGGASAEKFIAAVVFENVDQADPTSSEVRRLEQTGVSPSTLAVTSADGDLVFDMIDTYRADAPSTLTVGVDQAQLHDQSGSSFSGGFAHYSTSTKDGAAGATTSWSTNAIALQHMAMNIKAAPLSGSLTIVKEANPEDGTDVTVQSLYCILKNEIS